MRHKDDDWLLIVKWTLFAMVNAEELGITSMNIDQALKSKKPDVMRFVGTEGDYGEEPGLTKNWPCASFATWATTAKFMSAMSALARGSASRVVSINCGTPAMVATTDENAVFGFPQGVAELSQPAS